jgi:hypothetical protein
MEPRQTKAILGLIILVLCSWLAALAWPARRNREVAQTEAHFDAARAFNQTREFVGRYPRRVIGSIESRQSTGFLKEQLAVLGYQISYSHFDATIAGHRQVGRNILAYRSGLDPKIVAVIAHYDTAPTTLQGAMDDGSGIGVLLELARVFSAEPINCGLLFIASDGEEYGMLGAVDISQNYLDRKRILAVLSLDHVSIRDLDAFLVGTAGQFGGYSPAWLRELVRDALVPEGVPIYEPAGLEEHLQRAFRLSLNDQGPFLRAGIPAINLGSRSKDVAREQAIYHSEADRIENLTPSSFHTYGRGAERILRRLVAWTAESGDSMGDMRVMDSKYLPARAILFLHCITFIPYVAMVWFHLINHGKYLRFSRIKPELIVVGISLLLFVIAYLYVLVCWLLRQIPRYNLYPGTAKDPVLSHPSWGVSIGLLTILVCGLAAIYFLSRFLARTTLRSDFYVSKLILLFCLLLVILLALVYNSYWAVVFLAFPAWIWALVGPGTGPGGRAANRIWILGASIPCWVFLFSVAAEMAPNSNRLWWSIIALSTGTFGLRCYLLGAAALILGFRFAAIQSQSRID